VPTHSKEESVITFGFLGSDKNAGKTTALGFISSRLRKQGKQIILTSVGINGEAYDTYEGDPKPEVFVEKGDLFITNALHLRGQIGKFQLLERYQPPMFSKTYCLCRGIIPQNWVIEGPNDRASLLLLKKNLSKYKIMDGALLLDGSIDRQFMGHPKLCDGFYFSLLVTDRDQQRTKAAQLMEPITLPSANLQIKNTILKYQDSSTRSLLIKPDGKLIYHGSQPPFMDSDLKAQCLSLKDQHGILYLSGALTEKFSDFLSPFANLLVILDNFTLYQRVNVEERKRKFRPGIALLHPLKILGIFLKEVSDKPIPLPKGIPTHNLFREDHDDIGISRG